MDGSGHTALHIAAESGLLRMMELLIDAGASVDSLNSHGLTPLHLATIKLKLAAIKILLASGASPNKRDIHGRNPLNMIPNIPQTRPNVSIQDVEDNAAANLERSDIIRLLSAHIGSEEEDANTSMYSKPSSGKIAPATLHLSRVEQRSLTRKEGTKKVQTLRLEVEQAPSLSI